MPTGLRVMTPEGPAPANLSCLGQLEAPTPGSATAFTLPAISFGQVDGMGNPVLVPGLEIQVFADNVVPEALTCTGSCSIASDLGDGTYQLSLPEGGWWAYRVVERAAGPGPAVLRSMEVNAPASTEEFFNTIIEPVLTGLHQSLGVPLDTSAATVSGRFVDCDGQPVEGAQISLTDATGNTIDFDASTLALYLDPLPDPSLAATTFEGRWASTNVPLHAGGVAVHVWSDNDVLVGCEVFPVAATGLSTGRIRPLRADAASACSAARR